MSRTSVTRCEVLGHGCTSSRPLRGFPSLFPRSARTRPPSSQAQSTFFHSLETVAFRLRPHRDHPLPSHRDLSVFIDIYPRQRSTSRSPAGGGKASTTPSTSVSRQNGAHSDEAAALHRQLLSSWREGSRSRRQDGGGRDAK